MSGTTTYRSTCFLTSCRARLRHRAGHGAAALTACPARCALMTHRLSSAQWFRTALQQLAWPWIMWNGRQASANGPWPELGNKGVCVCVCVSLRVCVYVCMCVYILMGVHIWDPIFQCHVNVSCSCLSWNISVCVLRNINILRRTSDCNICLCVKWEICLNCFWFVADAAHTHHFKYVCLCVGLKMTGYNNLSPTLAFLR